MADTDRFAIGYTYPMEVELSPLTPVGADGKPMVSQKSYLDYVNLSYIDSGAMLVELENTRSGATQVYPVRSDFGKPLGSIHSVSDRPVYNVYTETGRRQMGLRGRVETTKLKIKNVSALPCRLSVIQQVGTSLEDG